MCRTDSAAYCDPSNLTVNLSRSFRTSRSHYIESANVELGLPLARMSVFSRAVCVHTNPFREHRTGAKKSHRPYRISPALSLCAREGSPQVSSNGAVKYASRVLQHEAKSTVHLSACKSTPGCSRQALQSIVSGRVKRIEPST